ncbi:MAG: hypothetical protein RJA98_366 [Pseudomonadota bacterium]|jgi:Cu2+-exporting ATPase
MTFALSPEHPPLVDRPAAPADSAEAGLLALDNPLEQGEFTHWLTDAEGARVGVSQFRLSGMTCAACAGLIENALMTVPGVQSARVSASAERAEVRWAPHTTRPSAMVNAVRRAGYDAVPDVAAPARALREREHRKAIWRLFVAGFSMMQVMMYATPAYVAAPGDIAPDLLKLLQWASWLLSIPAVLFSAGPFFSGAWHSLRARRIGMDVPVALGVAVTFIASTGATFDPGGMFGHAVYFDSLTMFIFFLLGGRTLELRARHRVAAALEAAVARLPETVLRLLPDGRSERVTPRQLLVGDRVQVSVGQAFPADGPLLSGATQVDESLLTGESMPVVKREGDELVAGSLNLLAPVTQQVLRLGADTRYEGIVALMRGALTQRPALVRDADRWAGPFLWGVLLLAAGGAALWSLSDPSRAVWVAVSVLIVTCPCALSLAAPSALLSAAGALAKRGVLLHRLDAMEALARADWLVLDKTGTLTEDRLVLRASELTAAAATSRCDADDLRTQASALAAHSLHPLSRALAESAPRAPAHAALWADVSELAGLGLQARSTVDGRWYRLGAVTWVEEGAATDTATDPLADAALAMPRSLSPLHDAADARVAFGPLGAAWMHFDFDEVLRADAAAAVRQAQADGLHVVLLSGDTEPRVAALARQLGINDVRAAATPQDKLDVVAQAQATGHTVVMVGDGLNDAPVLARADVSFAFAHGAAVSQSHADAVLLSTRLGDVMQARALARRSLRVIRQNLGWAVLYNASCIPLALSGWLPPWAAGLGMASSSLFVVLNSLRLARPLAPTDTPPMGTRQPVAA